MNKISLINLRDHEGAVVVGIAGGLNAKRRLENMGIRVGKHVTK